MEFGMAAPRESFPEHKSGMFRGTHLHMWPLDGGTVLCDLIAHIH